MSDKWITGLCGGLTKTYSLSPIAVRFIYILPFLILGIIPLLVIHIIASLAVKQS